MADLEVLNYPMFQSGPSWKNPVIFESPIDVKKVTIKLKVLTSARIRVSGIVEVVQTNNDYGDLEDVTASTNNSDTVMFIVLDTQDNKDQLEKDNSDIAVAKGAYFTAGSYIDCALLIPGMIVGVYLAVSEDADVKVGAALYAKGVDTDYGPVMLDDGGGAAYTNMLGKSLSQILVSTVEEQIVMLVTH
jgi:hypothetical protein